MQASGAGNGGVVPPPEHRWQPGESGNPAGRRTAGATIREWVNQFAAQDLTEAQVRRVARDPRSPWTKRAAAERVLRTMEAGDLADMDQLLSGEVSLQGLRDQGVNTSIIKKIKVKTRTLYGEGGPEGEEVTREVELHDRAGEEFDRICDRTDGRPTQTTHLTSDGSFIEEPTVLEKVVAKPPAAAGGK